LAAWLGLVGCATGDVVMMTTIAGGEKIRIPLDRSGVILASEGGIKITSVTYALKPEKHLTYVFGFTDAQKRSLRRVRVEDVSDEAPVALVDTTDPILGAHGEWAGESAPLAATDPRLGWLLGLPNTLRVFRFTFTFADGHTLVLHQGSMFSQAMKSAVRHEFGYKY
jgi:hypothetical protein